MAILFFAKQDLTPMLFEYGYEAKIKNMLAWHDNSGH